MHSFLVDLTMEITSTNQGNDTENEENTAQIIQSYILSKGETIVQKRRRRKSIPGTTLILNIRSSSRVKLTCREFYLLNFRNGIPKHITTLEEKYALRCLESIRKCALRAASKNFNTKVDIDVLPDMTSLGELEGLSSNSTNRLAIECPLVVGSNVITNPTGDWTIGTVSGSQSMINILTSPLLQKYGSINGNIVDDIYISPRLMHRKDASISLTSSSSSDESISPLCGASFQGILQCTWKDQLPNHIFTVDDKQEGYVATAESSGSKNASDYVYTFHSRRNAKKECDGNLNELGLESVAKMQVSTSITLSLSHSEVRETQFILSIPDWTGETQTSDNATLRTKHKRLTRKVTDAFRSSHSTKQRSRSRLPGSSSSVFEDTSRVPSKDMHDSRLGEGRVVYKDAPNFEVAAIVVKDTYTNYKKAEFGGWGLKFLKKLRNNALSLENSRASECSRNGEECMTSVNVIIPAGFHGGPSPSSLTERWISGGHCDCGGWDIGCPLSILDTRLNIMDYSFPNFGEIKSVDIFMQGSDQNGPPVMKMANIREGLYYIHFRPNLSALQSFAIAAAIIHSRSPVLRPRSL